MTRRTILVTLIVSLALAAAFVLVRAQIVVLTLFGAIVIGEAIRPLVSRLSSAMPRDAAVGLSFALLFAVGAALWIAPLHLVAPEANVLWTKLGELAATLPAPDISSVRSIAEGLFRMETSIGSVVSVLALMFVMGAFWIASSEALMTFVLSLVPVEQRPGVSSLWREIGGKLASYVISTIVNGALVAVECTIVLLLLHAPYPVVLGLLQGLLIALPYLGTLIGVLVVGGAVIAAQGWIAAVVAMLAVALAQTLHGSFVAPLLFKRGLDVDPLVTVVSIAIGGALFGIFGVVLAVPAAAVVQTLIVRVAAPAIRRSNAVAAPPDAL